MSTAPANIDVQVRVLQFKFSIKQATCNQKLDGSRFIIFTTATGMICHEFYG